jgi:methylmalonyl-CoA mutase N-terminal domain/subunit
MTHSTGRQEPASAAEWKDAVWREAAARSAERAAPFRTPSGLELEPLYGGAPDGGFPGRHPYTRGIHPTMHRGRFWTMRQYAGFGSAADTNQRFRVAANPW